MPPAFRSRHAISTVPGITLVRPIELGALGAAALDASVRGAQLSKMSAMSMVSSDGRSGAAPFAPVLRQASSDRVGGESYSCMYNCGFVGTYDVVNHHEEAALCFGPDDDL